MGTKMAVSFANIFMALTETKLIQQSETKHREWKCCIDDVKYGIKKGESITWPGTNSSKETFEEDLLKFKQGLKARRYPGNIMEWSLSGVSFASRQSFLAHTQKLKGHQHLLRRGTGGRERAGSGRTGGGKREQK